MKREEIKSIFPDATDEQVKSVMDLNGKEVEKNKKLETELKEKNERLEKLNTEFEALKSSNAGAEEYKTKYEALVAENEAKAKQAEADRIAKEKEDSNRSAFEKAVTEYGKTLDDFYNEHTKNGCYDEFIKAINLEENVGKAYKDILHNIVKDSGTYWKGVTAVKLQGGRPMGTVTGKYNSREEIIGIKDAKTRQSEMLAHPHLFPEIQV